MILAVKPGLPMTKPIARDPTYRERVFDAEIPREEPQPNLTRVPC